MSLNTFPFQLYCILSSKIQDNSVIPYNYIQYLSIQLPYSSIQSLAFLTIITLQHKHSHTYTLKPTHTPILTPTHHTYTLTPTHTATPTLTEGTLPERNKVGHRLVTRKLQQHSIFCFTQAQQLSIKRTKVRVNQSRFV